MPASGGVDRSAYSCAKLFRARRVWYHRCCDVAIVMGNSGGCSRFSINSMVNPKIYTGSDPTPGRTIYGTQAKSASTTVCAPQVPLAIALAINSGKFSDRPPPTDLCLLIQFIVID